MASIFERRTHEEIMQSQEVQWKIRLLEYIIPRIDGDLAQKEIIADMVMAAMLEAQIEGLHLAASLVDGVALYSPEQHKRCLHATSAAINDFAKMKSGFLPAPLETEGKDG